LKIKKQKAQTQTGCNYIELCTTKNLENQETKGTNANGGKSEDYCTFCYKNGTFTQNISIDEIIEINLKHLDQWNKNSGQNLTTEENKKQRNIYAKPKRWKQKQ